MRSLTDTLTVRTCSLWMCVCVGGVKPQLTGGLSTVMASGCVSKESIRSSQPEDSFQDRQGGSMGKSLPSRFTT